eukprot:4235412-Alexandrium_andersonii.AAC.1
MPRLASHSGPIGCPLIVSDFVLRAGQVSRLCHAEFALRARPVSAVCHAQVRFGMAVPFGALCVVPSTTRAPAQFPP